MTPLGLAEQASVRNQADGGKVQYFDLSARDLKAIENGRLEFLALTRTATESMRKSDYDDDGYDDEDEEDETANLGDHVHSSLQRTQSLAHIRVSRPGVIRLERVIHSSSIDARVAYPTSVSVAPCPRASFVDDAILTKDETIRCAGEDPDLNIMIDIYGVPPLSLRWYKDVNGKRESFMVEGIEAGHRGHGHADAAELRHKDEHNASGNGGSQVEKGVPQDLRVPLTVSVNALGTHSYGLESVLDGLGNEVQLGPEAFSALAGTLRKVAHPVHGQDGNATLGIGANTKVTRSLRVLRRPSVAWSSCGPGHPASLLIGSEAILAVTPKEVDALDTPLEVTVKYQPSPEQAETAGKIISNLSLGSGKKARPWTKKFSTQPEKRNLHLNVGSPGEYVITGVRGKHCEGDVLSPETCKVVEMPHPTAEIEWKRIHEWYDLCTPLGL